MLAALGCVAIAGGGRAVAGESGRGVLQRGVKAHMLGTRTHSQLDAAGVQAPKEWTGRSAPLKRKGSAARILV